MISTANDSENVNLFVWEEHKVYTGAIERSFTY